MAVSGGALFPFEEGEARKKPESKTGRRREEEQRRSGHLNCGKQQASGYGFEILEYDDDKDHCDERGNAQLEVFHFIPPPKLAESAPELALGVLDFSPCLS